MTKARDNATQGGLVLLNTTTFSAQSTVSINNCFSSTYDNYRIMSMITCSASATTQLRWRVAGTDASGTDYYRQHMSSQGTNVSSYGSNDNLGYINPSGITAKQQTTIDIADVAKAATTLATMSTSAGASQNWFTTSYHSLATAYDGITIYPSSGTITGTIRVYGYKN